MTTEEQEAIGMIAQAASMLGWQISFPSEEEVNYIIIAKPEVIDEVIKKIEA